MEAIELLKKARKDEKEIERLNKERTDFLEKLKKKRRKIERRYNNQIYKIEEKIRKEIYKIDKIIDKEKEKYDKEISEKYESITKLNRIFTFFRIIENEKFEKDTPRGEIIETIRDDDFAKICAYISENYKPVNKYSLRLAIYCFFSWTNLKDFDNIISSYYKNSIIDKPTKEKAIEYWNKNKKNLIKPIMEKIDSLILEYKEAVELYKIKDFKIAYLEKEKEYYEKEYFGGTKTKEYHNIIVKLVELTKKEKYKDILNNLVIEEL